MEDIRIMTDIDNVVQLNDKQVELSDGRKVAIPRLTNKKVLQLVKYVAGDGMIMYNKFLDWQEENTERTPQYDEEGNPKVDENLNYLYRVQGPSMEDAVDKLIEIVPDEKLLKILSILIDVPESEIEDMDFFDTSIIIAGFLEITPIEKLVSVVKKVRSKFRPMSKEQLNQATQQQPQQPTPAMNSTQPYNSTPNE